MTEYVFMLNQNVPTNAPDGPIPTQVTISGSPARGHATLSVSGPNMGGTRASLWCLTGISPYGYTQTVPLVTFNIVPGAPESQTLPVELGNLSYYRSFFAELNLVDGSGETAATMTMVV